MLLVSFKQLTRFSRSFPTRTRFSSLNFSTVSSEYFKEMLRGNHWTILRIKYCLPDIGSLPRGSLRSSALSQNTILGWGHIEQRQRETFQQPPPRIEKDSNTFPQPPGVDSLSPTGKFPSDKLLPENLGPNERESPVQHNQLPSPSSERGAIDPKKDQLSMNERRKSCSETSYEQELSMKP